jgi:hypothetical protein
MNKLILLALVLASTPAAADSLGAEPQDRGRITHVQRGVKEIHAGGMFVLSHDQRADSSMTRVSTLGGLGFDYFIRDNVSVGGAALMSYDRQTADTSSTEFGGMLSGTLHVRLGLGAFLRPTLGAGAMFGKQTTAMTGGQLMSASQASGLLRIGLPIAYFAGPRIVLQAGPELDIRAGSVFPEGAKAQVFTTISGGFGVSGGYVF